MTDAWAHVLVEIVRNAGTWDMGALLFAVLISPWAALIVTAIVLSRMQRVANQRRADDDTAIRALSAQIADLGSRNDGIEQLLHNYEQLTRDYRNSVDTMLEYVRQNTQTLTAIAEHIKWIQK